jgi:hypothetical protein
MYDWKMTQDAFLHHQTALPTLYHHHHHFHIFFQQTHTPPDTSHFTWTAKGT